MSKKEQEITDESAVEEQEIKIEQEEEKSSDESTQETEIEPTEEINEFELKFTEVNDKYLRLYSDFENFRKRTAKEKLDLINNAGQDMMAAMLPLLDDTERGIKSNETSDDIEAVKEGLKLISQKLNSILTSKGLKPMEVEQGAEFNLDLHEAITKIPAPNKSLKGKVVDVIEKGYYLNDKVIRYSKVVIGE